MTCFLPRQTFRCPRPSSRRRRVSGRPCRMSGCRRPAPTTFRPLMDSSLRLEELTRRQPRPPRLRPSAQCRSPLRWADQQTAWPNTSSNRVTPGGRSLNEPTAMVACTEPCSRGTAAVIPGSHLFQARGSTCRRSIDSQQPGRPSCPESDVRRSRQKRLSHSKNACRVYALSARFECLSFSRLLFPPVPRKCLSFSLSIPFPLPPKMPVLFPAFWKMPVLFPLFLEDACPFPSFPCFPAFPFSFAETLSRRGCSCSESRRS
jgi:hypothetical protein